MTSFRWHSQRDKTIVTEKRLMAIGGFGGMVRLTTKLYKESIWDYECVSYVDCDGGYMIVCILSPHTTVHMMVYCV